MLSGGLERVAHANLLVGPAGVGKRQFAEALTALLLCEDVKAVSTAAPVQSACGQCPSCRWLASDSHPDFRRLIADDEAEDEAGTPDAPPARVANSKKKPSTIVKIDAVRALEDFVFVGSHRHGRRVVLIPIAEQMNLPAANALLKILEEPPLGVYFILVTSRPRYLLPTVRSRCRVLSFGTPSPEQGAAWLRSHGADSRSARFLDVAAGAPLQVLEWQEQGVLAPLETALEALQQNRDPLVLARVWDDLLKREPALSLDALVAAIQRWLIDIALASQNLPARYHGRWNLPTSAATCSLELTTRGWRELLRFRRSSRHPLNTQLFLEELAVFVLHATSTPDARANAAGKR